MAALIRVGRRTAERMRDAVEAAFGPLEREDDGRRVRFRLAARGLGNFASAPTADELAELENAARALEATGNESRAATLRSLGMKIGASLREADRRRLGVDVEAQLRAEAFACQVGARPLADPTVLARLREALIAGIMVKFMESRRGGARSSPMASCSVRAPTWSPASRAAAAPVLFRLDAIHGLEVLDEPGAPPQDFDLRAYAERSFGVFQKEPLEVEFRFAPSAAPDARAFLFHPTQTLSDEPDGSLTVRFRAGGMLLAMNADDDRQRLLEIGASRGRLALIEHRGWKHRGHDRRLAVVRRGLVLEAGLPGDELPLGEGVMLIEALRELLQHPLADFGGIVCPRFVPPREAPGSFVLQCSRPCRPRFVCCAFAIDRTTQRQNRT